MMIIPIMLRSKEFLAENAGDEYSRPTARLLKVHRTEQRKHSICHCNLKKCTFEQKLRRCC